MTPSANDLCVFAVKRGKIKNSELYCNPLYPFFLALTERYRQSKYCAGIMSDYVDVNPKTNCSSLRDDTMVSFVPMPNVQEKNNIVTYDSVPYSQVKKGFTVFEKGDLIWAKITPCMQNGKSCITDKMPTDIGFGSTEFHVIRKRRNDVYMPFLWAIFSNEDVLKAAQATFSGSAGQQRVSASFIEHFPAVVPKYNLQVKLVVELEKKLAEMNIKLQQAKDLFSGLDSYTYHLLGIEEESSEKPQVFAVKGSRVLNSRMDTEYHNPYYTSRVNEIMKVSHDILGNVVEFSNEVWNQSDYFENEFPYIEISDVKLRENSYNISIISKEIAPSRAKMVVRNGDILVSTTRPHRGAIATVICDDNSIQIASTGFCVLRDIKCPEVSKNYLQWILLNDYILQQMLQRSSGGNYPAIGADELKKIVIPIPSKEIQAQICCEANRRKQLAEELRIQAKQEWATAKAHFEKELLGE